MERLRVLVSPTTMQGDVYAVTRYLQQRVEAGDPLDLVLAVDDPTAYREEVIHRLLPLDTQMWDRSEWLHLHHAKRFAPHFWIADNHLPKKRVFQNLIYLWHGFGWKEQRAEIEFKTVHEELDALVGGVRQPNPHFVHQCYGAFEKSHRVAHTQFHPENCGILGNLYADLLISPPVTKSEVAKFYPFADPRKKTVLLGFTWGFGKVFEHWNVDEAALMRRLFEFLAERDCNVIFRLHDRKRYETSYLQMLADVSKRFGNVLLKFKDVERDNLCDVLMSDVIVSNFSGIVVYAYFTGAASIHLHPFGETSEPKPLYRFSRGRAIADPSANFTWKMPPEENGGLLARTPQQMFESIERALADPTCCVPISESFRAKYMETSDGASCARFYRYLTAWHACAAKPSVSEAFDTPRP